ncbi:hypothetical protein KO566_09080 [Flavobacteriaceae bacterium XHP0103]|uniref:hypothetical protein n=1 Tax=Marixanthotalea marina TaxID=2844359 RepID=UPI002989AE6B|nr:hypothetical protein [Marixanthotalea marina]MBU3822211.1 hypothetical protein [Marixanthotalea marina]
MNQNLIYFFLAFFCCTYLVNAQESDDYIEFNDRKNTVHGVYLGLGTYYGKIDKADTYAMTFQIAYVANQQFEVGFVGVGFYSDLNRQGLNFNDRDLFGGYGGLHLQPILFSKSKLNLSFPLLIGGGAVGLIDRDFENTIEDDDWQPVFVFEPGVSLLFNISRYIQLEAAVKHRFSSRINFKPEYGLSNINGFSAGLGIKVGVFNMGRNRYKQKTIN